MSGSALLVHISASQSQAVVKALTSNDKMAVGASVNDLERVFDCFSEKLKSQELVHFCVENAVILAALQRRLPEAKVLSWKSEISAVRALFADKLIMHIGIANGIYPLLDETLNEKLFSIHCEYRADMSYAENLPPGMALNYASRDLLESLDIMEAKDDDLATGIRPFVEKNINQFHVEVHYEEPDLRLLRLDFSLSSYRSLVKSIAFEEKIGQAKNPYAQMQGLLNASPEMLHVFPSYVELEFSATAEAVSLFSPLGFIEQPKALLSRQHFEIVTQFIGTGLGDTSVCASGLGEPLEHPEAISFLSDLLDDANIRHIFVETNGIHLEKMLPLVAHRAAEKLRVIVLLNSLDRYSELCGAPEHTLAAVKSGVRKLSAALTAAGKNAAEIVHLQALKVEENEAEIDTLYALAEELGATFLLQKYNRYAGLMPERRVSDMTPLERYSCWHLRRDLFIRANGDVAFCKQTVDTQKPTARGNIGQDSLKDLWLLQRADYVRNFKGDYPNHLPCANCDEYFTFNF